MMIMKLIDKDKVVAKIEKRIKETESMQPKSDQFWAGQISAFKGVLKILDTLEVKEVYEHNDSDLNSIIEEIGIEPDSKLAKMFKAAFYKSVDNYLTKKGE